MTWQSTKTITHAAGVSACFRQWRATHSHCSQLHGYALQFTITFEAEELDDRQWVVDFGGLKELQAYVRETFDHRLVVAADDPAIEVFRSLEGSGLAKVTLLPEGVGCERFAEHVAKWASAWVSRNRPGARVVAVECREHEGNSALWRAD